MGLGGSECSRTGGSQHIGDGGHRVACLGGHKAAGLGDRIQWGHGAAGLRDDSAVGLGLFRTQQGWGPGGSRAVGHNTAGLEAMGQQHWGL